MYWTETFLDPLRLLGAGDILKEMCEYGREQNGVSNEQLKRREWLARNIFLQWLVEVWNWDLK